MLHVVPRLAGKGAVWCSPRLAGGKQGTPYSMNTDWLGVKAEYVMDPVLVTVGTSYNADPRVA